MEMANHLHPLRVLPILLFKVDVLDEEEATLHPLVAHGSAHITRHRPGSNQPIQAFEVETRRPWLVCYVRSPAVVAHSSSSFRPALWRFLLSFWLDISQL
jgi:hypothetical protein